ncbi:MAG: diphosphomevalonate decarboxylase [Anaerolinea sp.]|nr:diphosphomevalonate decarboxylase [Anaerolinea sp.]
MSTSTATAVSHPNIAFIKYWGNRDHPTRLPENGSISMNLSELTTRTRVTFDPSLPNDIFDLNGIRQTTASLQRVTSHLNLIRGLRGVSTRAHVHSENNFPAGAGIASSASAFAALTLAAVNALGLEMSEKDLSRLARRGSGSACRSIPSGFVEWYRGISDIDSFAVSIAKPSHWDLVDCIAVVESGHKKTGSTEGHKLASTSPLQNARVQDTDRRLDRCRDAIIARDFETFAEIIEQDSNLMHAVMMTSRPALLYWEPATIEIIKAVQAWRKAGIPAAYTVDAGPNVHIISEAKSLDAIKHRLSSLPGVKEILIAHPGGPAKIV